MNIRKILESIRSLHGEERDQTAKHRDYVGWMEQVRQSQQSHCVRSFMPTVPHRESEGDR